MKLWILVLAVAGLLAGCERAPERRAAPSSNEGKAAQSAGGTSADEGKAARSAGF